MTAPKGMNIYIYIYINPRYQKEKYWFTVAETIQDAQLLNQKGKDIVVVKEVYFSPHGSFERSEPHLVVEAIQPSGERTMPEWFINNLKEYIKKELDADAVIAVTVHKN